MLYIFYSTLVLIIGTLMYWLVLPEKWRSKFLFAASIFFMSLFSIPFTAYFLLNILLVYMAGIYMGRSESNSKLLLKLSVIWLIGSLCVFKYTHILINSLFELGFQLDIMTETMLEKIALPLGTSYIMFRLIHYIIEVYKKNLPAHTFWDLGLYVCFFPTFLAGPVERFQRFHPQNVENKPLDTSDINYALFRIISGILKKFIIADSLTKIIMPVLTAPQEHPRIFLILAVYGLAIRLYMDFSGYTDMALGVARLFGYKIMENFNYPFFKQNVADFWRNWHISVYSFIRDYFFFPIFGHRATQWKIYIGIFATMIVFMLWHELSLPFFITGIYAGAGLVVWQLFQELKRKYRVLRKIVDSRYSGPFSTFLTFTHISFGFIFFSFDMGSIKNILYYLFT